MPHPCAFTLPELWSEDARTRVEITRAANATTSAVGSLSGGDVIEGKAELGSTGFWKRAGSLTQSASCEVLRGVIEDYRWSGEVSTGTLASTPSSDEESYRFVTAKSNKGYSGGDAPTLKGVSRVLPRGAIADGPLEDLALPPPDLEPLDVMQVSEEIQAVYDDFQKSMLRKPEDVEWDKIDAIKPYWSPT